MKVKYLEIALVLFTLIGGTYAASRVFATNERVDVVEQDLKEYKMVQRLHALEERVWAYDEKYGFGCERCPEEAKRTDLRLKQEIRDIERQLSEKS